MSILAKLKVLFQLERTAKAVQVAMKTKDSTKIIAAISVALTGILQIDAVHQLVVAFLQNHPVVSGIVGLIAALTALFHVPVKDATKVAAALLLALLLVPAGLHAQTTEGNLPANVYAVGPSYNPAASPSIAGSAFYGRLVAGSGTYAFTVLDALPEPVKPFTVSTNIGAGIAQKLVTFRGVPIYGAAGTGINWTGSDTNWQWNGGALAAIPLKVACATCYLMPNARFLSVGGGQYRPIAGLWFGFGQ